MTGCTRQDCVKPQCWTVLVLPAATELEVIGLKVLGIGP